MEICGWGTGDWLICTTEVLCTETCDCEVRGRENLDPDDLEAIEEALELVFTSAPTSNLDVAGAGTGCSESLTNMGITCVIAGWLFLE